MQSIVELLSPSRIEELYIKVARGLIHVPERDEWLEWCGGSTERLEATLLRILEALRKINTQVIYPLEFKVVPRLPFSKKPAVEWRELQQAGLDDPKVTELKMRCGQLGKLVNAAIVAANLLVIDVDGKPQELRDYADVETRRGYHIVRFVKDAEALLIDGSFKRIYASSAARIEVFSGPWYLWSYPPQSRWLERREGRINVYCYKVVSSELSNALASGDLEPITVTPDEAVETLKDVLKVLGLEGYAEKLEFKPVEKASEINGFFRQSNPKESRFNTNSLPAIGELTYRQFKDKLSSTTGTLPRCLEAALYGSPPKGSRYFHLRLLVAVIPYFVFLTPEEVRRVVEDFSLRTRSKPSEARQWDYCFKYFTGKIRFNGVEVRVPSKLGVPQEAWDAFATLGYCDTCPLADECKDKPGHVKRRLIVSYVSTLLGDVE